jgi:hypothetical protein
MAKYSIHRYIVFIQILCSYRDNYQYSKTLDSIIDNVRNDIKPYLYGENYVDNDIEIIDELKNIRINLILLLKKIRPDHFAFN